MKLRSHIGADGVLQVQMPDNFRGTSVEVFVVIQNQDSEEETPQYNTWGKQVTEPSSQKAIVQLQQLQKDVALEPSSIRDLIEEGRRF
ncbi:hypothetical protein E1H12_15665 [Geitlerinema sp. P-1104]|uniref:hypothetical protein n=1 Tax=Geitlerinema sp. P-1104 TaxID=2546230 RepID=UPI0014772629|nr:hypothetical protein [Geitlerinema sp. P-1104]NMG59915.1 hypothetical protein [Geitlerinema sp. P-1104]